jgi:hypothetical protein
MKVNPVLGEILERVERIPRKQKSDFERVCLAEAIM